MTTSEKIEVLTTAAAARDVNGERIMTGDTVRVCPGICGEGHRFVVRSFGTSGHGEAIVYGDNYGPVRAHEVEVLSL